MWDIWGSYYNIPKAIFCLLKGDYRIWDLGSTGSIRCIWGLGLGIELFHAIFIGVHGVCGCSGFRI